MKITLPKRASNPASKGPGLAFDCELAARIHDGDQIALARLVDRHAGRINTYLLHRLGPGHDELIERVVAATFSQAIRQLRPYVRGTASTPMDLWLIRLAERNLAHTRHGASAQIEQAPPRSDLARLRDAISTLPKRHAFVLALAVYEQMPATEIAQTLSVTPAAAMRRLRSALKSVGAALQKQEEAE